MTKCPRFFQCDEHWGADELAEMAPDRPSVPPDDRPDWVKPDLEEVKK